jgi:hypothetical protein
VPAPKPQTIEDMAALLKPDRTAFAALYDRERPSGAPDFKSLAVQRQRASGETEEERTRQDMLAALRRAETDQWLTHFTPAKLRDLSDDPEVIIALQAITNPNVDFDHIGDVSDGVLKAMRRCCRVVCGDDGDAVKGSGFLIGPQLVLTNWHVVQAQIEADRAQADVNEKRAKAAAKAGQALQQGEMPSAPIKVHVEFDSFRNRDGSVTPHVEERVIDKWLVISSPADGGQPPTIGVERILPSDPEVMKTCIDFAILELANPVGYERGWYDLSADLPPPAPKAQGVLVQFPGNYAMRVTAGPYLKKPALPARVCHSMNTINGSSGGLCATSAYEPLALHQGALRLRQKMDSVEKTKLIMGDRNVAIPLGLIAQMAGQAISLRIRDAPAKIYQAVDGRPIVGREGLQRAIHESIYGPNRIILVRNSYDQETGQLKNGIGKSFTVTILEAMTTPAEHLIRVVGSGALPADPYAAAQALAAPFRDPSADGAILQAFDALAGAAPRGDTTQDADVRILADLLLAVLLLAAGRRTLWLVIDDLDRHPIDSDSQTANLLNLLYTSISMQPHLRAVLIGPTATLPMLESLNVRIEGPLRDFQAAEIERWIMLARGHDRPLAAEYIAMLQKMVVATLPNWKPEEPLSQTARIAQILTTTVGPLLA